MFPLPNYRIYCHYQTREKNVIAKPYKILPLLKYRNYFHYQTIENDAITKLYKILPLTNCTEKNSITKQ